MEILHVFGPQIFFGGGSVPGIFGLIYKSDTGSDHVAQFRGDRPREPWDYAFKKKKTSRASRARRPHIPYYHAGGLITSYYKCIHCLCHFILNSKFENNILRSKAALNKSWTNHQPFIKFSKNRNSRDMVNSVTRLVIPQPVENWGPPNIMIIALSTDIFVWCLFGEWWPNAFWGSRCHVTVRKITDQHVQSQN